MKILHTIVKTGLRPVSKDRIGLRPISLLLIFLSFLGFAQAQTIELKQCLDSAVVHYPTYRQAALYDQELELTIKTIKQQNLPQADLNGRATWQSDVTELGIKLPGVSIPELNHDQYKISLDVTQTIYKGGLTSKQIELEEINSQINKKQSFSELYALKQRVSALYFQLILNQKQMELTQILENTLNSKMKEMEAGLQNGILLSTVTNNLKVEIAKLNQQKTELQFEKLKLLSNLKLLTGLNLTAETQFKLPENETSVTQSQSRIEMEIFDLQKKKVEEMKSLSSSKNLPMVYSFANLGYGRPGYNMLSNEFQDFQMIGVGMSWKLWNWNEYKRDRQILDLSSQSINIKKENFEIEIQMALDQQIAEIKKMNELINSDDEIIKLRSQIAETTNVQLLNGTATPAQYIDELNKLNQAKLENELHKIKLSLAQVNYLWIMGKL